MRRKNVSSGGTRLLYGVFLRAVFMSGGLSIMNLLEKFEAVTVEADNRITQEDREYCETQQAAYDAAVQSFQELDFFWADMERTQMELLGTKDSGYLSSREGPSISDNQIRNHLEYLHRKVIGSIVTYFNSTYHVSVSIKDVCDNLLPKEPDCRRVENEEAYEEYHEKLRSAKVSYKDVVDQIILLLDGRSFAEQAFHELAEKCHKAAWNMYQKTASYERKKSQISFVGYYCRYKHWSWQDEWELENKAKDILRGISHFETGSYCFYPLGISELLCNYRQNDSEMEFPTCEKVKCLKMFKNGRVDIRFSSETYAAEFTAKYLGLVC